MLSEITPAQWQAAQIQALRLWAEPNRGFATGFDARSSDNALQVHFYGGLVHAAEHDWLNAGRRLIDKTYVDMLIQTQGLDELRAVGAERIAANLDGFLRNTLRPRWPELGPGAETTEPASADELVESATRTLFGSVGSRHAAQRLLFFLCPMLPITPRLDQAGAATPTRFPTGSVVKMPSAVYGDARQRLLVSEVMAETDWWLRRVTALAHRDSEQPQSSPVDQAPHPSLS